MKKRILIFAVFTAVLLIGGGVFVLRNQRISEVVTEEQSQDTSFNQQVEAPEPQASTDSGQVNTAPSLPTRLQVQSVGIDIPVAKGYYNSNTQKWTLSLNKAHFAMMTKLPNTQTGNTYIYGHNRKGVFSSLPRIKQGAEAVVVTENNQTFRYRLTRSITTKPEDDSMLFYKGPPVLTLQTCTGAFYQNRTLYVFELVGVDNA